jgi:hypothetical protein
LLDKANAKSHSALNDVRETADDLRVQEASLRDQLVTPLSAASAVDELRALCSTPLAW